jgi:hypothetical protein
MTGSIEIQNYCMQLIVGSIKSPPSYWLILASLPVRPALMQCFFGSTFSLPRVGGGIRHLLISVRDRSRINDKLAAWRPPVLWIFPASDIVDDHCPSKDKASRGHDAWDEAP